MKKLLTLLTLALLTTACVPHDADEEVVLDPYYTQQPSARTVIVQQPQRVPQQQPIIVQAQQPVQQQPVVVQVKQPPQQTWWQQNKQKHVVKVVTPTCPCEDPNDPCTHCYSK